MTKVVLFINNPFLRFPNVLWRNPKLSFRFQSPSGRNEIRGTSLWWNLLMWCLSKLLIKHTHTHINFTWSPVNLSRTQSHILVASGSDPVLSNKKQLALVNTAQQKIYSARRWPGEAINQVDHHLLTKANSTWHFFKGGFHNIRNILTNAIHSLWNGAFGVYILIWFLTCV